MSNAWLTAGFKPGYPKHSQTPGSIELFGGAPKLTSLTNQKEDLSVAQASYCSMP